ncbi:DUF4102 domain-containing protein [Parashewanella curva]|uniref:DUF4102 domain-containing protein n=1 Tax=Parashewanella curva TaxID=2338552 RepID=A0A3L8PUA2_9GAMM|nr:tyrosine-type recombinase/integrase [Parashewanella curva]RLV58399.1 DUF4102 domain-containing protein [Parashewanella curva]
MPVLNKLSVKAIEALKAQGKVVRKSDGGGLYLLVKVNQTKFWEFRYTRPVTGKKTLMGLGSFQTVSLADARKKASIYRAQLAEGIDPQLFIAEQKRIHAEEQANSFLVLAQQWKSTKEGHLKPKTISDNWRKLENYVFPTLGSMPIKEITAPIAIQVLRPVETQGKLEMVKRCGQLMNEVMNYAVNSGLIHSNPLMGINKVFRKPKVTHLRAMEPDNIKELMQAIASANIYFGTRCLIEWQLHTMVRPAEPAGTKWCEINIEKAVWVIPPERMKMNREHKVPLTKQTIAILEAVRPLSGHLEHVFPSRYKYRQATDSETINKALGRMGLRNKTTAHGFRSLASTTLNEKGFHPEAVDAALAHVEPNKIRAAYKRTTYFKKRKKIMQWWSDHISKHAVGSYQVFDRKNLSEALIQTK